MIFNRPERKVLDTSALVEADLVFSNFSAAQPTERGFILLGTVHFNPGKVEFDNGQAQFALSRAIISAIGHNAACDYESIAYIARSSDAHAIDAQLTTSQSNDKADAVSVEGSGTISVTSVPRGSVAGTAYTSMTKMGSGEQIVTVHAEGTKSLIAAYPRRKIGNLAGQVDWIIDPDPLLPFTSSNGTHSVVLGERMASAGERAGLAAVEITEAGGYLELRLEVRAGWIVWTEIEFNEGSPLHQHGKRLIDGRGKRDIVGRIALGKALEGSVLLQRLPNNSVNEVADHGKNSEAGRKLG